MTAHHRLNDSVRNGITDSTFRASEPNGNGRELNQEAITSIHASEIVPDAVPAIEVETGSRLGHARLIALLGGAQATVLLAGIARLKLIALFLGPVGVGIAGVVDLTAQLALQLGALHIPTAALRFLSITREERGTQGFAWLYRTLLRVMLSVTGGVALVAMLVFLVWPSALSTSMVGYTGAAVLALAAVPLTGATNLIRNVLATLHRHQAAALALLTSGVLLVGSTFFGLRFAGLNGAYLAALLVGIVTVLMLHLLVRPSLRGAPGSVSGSLVSLLKAHPDIVRFSMTLYAVGFAVPLSYWIVRWTVLSTLGEREAGFLAVAYAIGAGLRAVFAQASTQYLIPLASRNLPKDIRAAESARYIRTLLLLLLAGGLPLLLFPYELIRALSSPAFLPAIAVVGTFILSEAIMAVGDTYRVLQLGLNDLKGYFVTTCSAAILVAAAIWWVAPRYGLFGTALLQVAAALLSLGWSMDRLRSRHDMRVEWRSVSMTVYVILVLSTAVLLGRAMPLPQLTWIGTKAVAGLVFLVFGAILLPSPERRAILSSLRLSPPQRATTP